MIITVKKILFVICFVLAASLQLRGEDLSALVDKVPRNRLITDTELINYLDDSVQDIKLIKKEFTGEDGTRLLEKLAHYFRNRKNVSYFFNSNEVENNFEVLKKEYPDYISKVIKTADKIKSKYGTDIDWKLPGVDNQGKELTPNTLRYLSRFTFAYGEVAEKYLSEGNQKIFADLLKQVKDFINDYSANLTESGRNDLFERFYAGNRIRNLLFAHNLMLGSPSYKWQDQIFMLKVFILHAAKLSDVCGKFHWGNHQLHGLAGLYETTIMYPEIPIMRYWNELALKGIMEHISKEIKDDGFQFERASHYFKLDIMNYFRIYRISVINNKKLPDLFLHRFHKMFDAIVALAMPDKKLPVLNDAQAVYPEKAGNKESINMAELPDPDPSLYMTIGATIFNNPEYKYFASQMFPPGLFWFFNENEREKYEKLSVKEPGLTSVSLPDSKFFVMRTGYKKNDLYLIIDGGLAKYKPDHTHGGILGVSAYGYGKILLPTYRVKYSSPHYKYMKNSLVKNVAVADNILQGKKWIDNKAGTGFGLWRYLPEPKVIDWFTGNNLDYFCGSHNGYNEIGINYQREVFFMKPFFWVVIDRFDSEKYHSYQQIWQGKYKILKDCNGIMKDNLFIIQTDYSDMDVNTFEKFNIFAARFTKNGRKAYSFNTIVFPVSEKNVDKPEVREFNRDDFYLIVVNLKNYVYKLFFAKNKMLGLAEVNTDAEFIVKKLNNHNLESLVFYNGTNCTFDGVNVTCNNPATLELTKNENSGWNYRVLKGNPEDVRMTENNL